MKKEKDASTGNASLHTTKGKYTTLQGKTQVIRELFIGKNPLFTERRV
jgi:hypothetical protein